MLGHYMTSDAYEAGLECWRLGKFTEALRWLKFAARGSRYADPHPDAADKLTQLQALLAETDGIDVFDVALSVLLGEDDTP